MNSAAARPASDLPAIVSIIPVLYPLCDKPAPQGCGKLVHVPGINLAPAWPPAHSKTSDAAAGAAMARTMPMSSCSSSKMGPAQMDNQWTWGRKHTYVYVYASPWRRCNARTAPNLVRCEAPRNKRKHPPPFLRLGRWFEHLCSLESRRHTRLGRSALETKERLRLPGQPLFDQPYHSRDDNAIAHAPTHPPSQSPPT